MITINGETFQMQELGEAAFLAFRRVDGVPEHWEDLPKKRRVAWTAAAMAVVDLVAPKKGDE